jgi:hypothetical protein
MLQFVSDFDSAYDFVDDEEEIAPNKNGIKESECSCYLSLINLLLIEINAVCLKVIFLESNDP